MSSYVLGFQDIDQTKIGVVGGKGANLGERDRKFEQGQRSALNKEQELLARLQLKSQTT